MNTAIQIRDALAQVAQLHQRTAQQPLLMAAVHAVKRLQAQRFAGTYADMLQTGDQGYAPAARFFMTELYGARDYSQRDAQFSRIAGTIEKLFPAKVSALALALAELHALSEELDHAMGCAWIAINKEAASAVPMRNSLAFQAQTYTQSWRTVTRQKDRHAQLRIVLGIGTELGRLTQTLGLRSLIRMMRGPASAAGLRTLQTFMENGFDTFAALAKAPGGIHGFLGMIEARESALMQLLFDADAVTCETELQHLLGQAP